MKCCRNRKTLSLPTLKHGTLCSHEDISRMCNSNTTCYDKLHMNCAPQPPFPSISFVSYDEWTCIEPCGTPVCDQRWWNLITMCNLEQFEICDVCNQHEYFTIIVFTWWQNGLLLSFYIKHVTWHAWNMWWSGDCQGWEHAVVIFGNFVGHMLWMWSCGGHLGHMWQPWCNHGVKRWWGMLLILWLHKTNSPSFSRMM